MRSLLITHDLKGAKLRSRSVFTEREGERDRQTDRQTDRQRQRQKRRQTDRQTDRQTETERQRQTDRDRGRRRENVCMPKHSKRTITEAEKVHFIFPLLAPSIRGPQLVWECVCVCVCVCVYACVHAYVRVCGWNEPEVCSMLAYPHISSFHTCQCCAQAHAHTHPQTI